MRGLGALARYWHRSQISNNTGLSIMNDLCKTYKDRMFKSLFGVNPP